MNKTDRRPSKGLRHQIYVFGGSMILMILLVGGLFGMAALRSIWSYQEIMTQMTDIQQLKGQVSTVSEQVQNRVVNGVENITECISAWEELNQRIWQLELLESSSTLRLLAEDLQAYQKGTASDFYVLIRESEPEKIMESYQEFLIHQEDRLFLCDQILKNLTEHMSSRYETILRQNAVSLALFAVLILSLLLLTGCFSFEMAEDVYQPVQRLTGQAEKIMEGDYQMEDLPVAQQDEIGQLTEAFNAMKNRVRENFQNQEELWRLESLLQDAEFRALQSQVNPHFLFNVLSVATEAALLENADSTVDIIEHISYMLHYGLTSVREDSWLADELKMVRSYLFLQKERFGDRITFLDSTPEELPVLRIPGMTLQPIVENAVKHGVERMTAGGKIEIILSQTPGAVEIYVEDNGCGIPQEQVDALNRGETVRGDSRSTGLGIANVRSRMAIFYKQEGLLKVESRDGEGTRVCLKYLVQEERQDVPGADRG